MPYYHATTVDRLPSILRHGLGGIDTGPRSEECERGVYLASHPMLAVAVGLEHMMNTECAEHGGSPREAVRAIRVIVVDDGRLDADRLRPDPHVDGWRGSWLYPGVIDVRGLPVLTSAEAKAGGESLDPAACGWSEAAHREGVE